MYRMVSMHPRNLWKTLFVLQSGPEVIKLFFMLNSAVYEIFSANKYENVNNS